MDELVIADMDVRLTRLEALVRAQGQTMEAIAEAIQQVTETMKLVAEAAVGRRMEGDGT